MKDCIEEKTLTIVGLRPTSNRILVLRELMRSDKPMSLTELEDAIATMDRSSIFRSLGIMSEHDILHSFRDGDGILKYEVCHSIADSSEDDDRHVHFFCTGCHRTFCFPTEKIPYVPYPDGFHVEAMNYMATGLCADCSKSQK